MMGPSKGCLELPLQHGCLPDTPKPSEHGSLDMLTMGRVLAPGLTHILSIVEVHGFLGAILPSGSRCPSIGVLSTLAPYWTLRVMFSTPTAVVKRTTKS